MHASECLSFVSSVIGDVEPNLIWNFIALNLHHLTHSKPQLNIIKVNYCKSNNIARSYQRRHRAGHTSIIKYNLLTFKDINPSQTFYL